MKPVNAPPPANPGTHLLKEKTKQPAKTRRENPKPAGTQHHTHPTKMPRKESTPWTESPLPEGRVGWRGVILRGGYSHIYLDNASAPPTAQTYGPLFAAYAPKVTSLIGT